MVNASPDSKADFSVVHDCAEAVARGTTLLAEGADYFDLGGEGSTLGSDEVTVGEEWQRVSGPLRGLLSLGADVAIDTRKPEVARKALDAGAAVLNAGDALQSPEMVELAAEREVTVVLPFMLGRDFRSVRDVSGDPVAVMVEWFGEHIERLQTSRGRARAAARLRRRVRSARHGLARTSRIPTIHLQRPGGVAPIRIAAVRAGALAADARPARTARLGALAEAGICARPPSSSGARAPRCDRCGEIGTAAAAADPSCHSSRADDVANNYT